MNGGELYDLSLGQQVQLLGMDVGVVVIYIHMYILYLFVSFFVSAYTCIHVYASRICF